MRIKRTLMSASFLMCTSIPAQADAITDFLNIAGSLVNEYPDLTQEKDASGSVTKVTGIIDGKSVVFTPDKPVSKDTKTVEITAETNGNTGQVEITTTGGGVRDIKIGDTFSFSGQLDGVSVDAVAAVPSKNDNSISGTLNGNAFEITIPEDTTFKDFDAKTDIVVVKKDGKEIFNGIAADATDVESAALASEFEAISSNPLSALANQAASLGGFFSLVSEGAFSSGPDGFSFSVAPGFSNTNGYNNTITHGYSPSGPSLDDTSFIYGAWAHAAYTDRTVENSIGTFDSTTATSVLGAHAIIQDDYLIGLAAGFQFSEGLTRGTTSSSSYDVAMVSPYAGARFLDDRLIVETALIYGLIDLDTQRAAAVSGNTRGHRFGGRLAVGYSMAVADDFTLTAKAGVMGGYDRYDAFTESNGTVVEAFEIAVGTVDLSLHGQYQVNETLSFKAGVKGLFDFSNDVLNNAIVEEFNNAGLELSAGLSFRLADRVTADLGGRYEVGLDDNLSGKGISGTVRISF